METFRLVASGAQDALTVAVWLLAAVALWRGGAPERASALTLFALLVTDDLYHLVIDPHYPLDRADPWHVFIDSAALVALLVIALRANRFYPMVLAAAQLVSVTAHLARATVPQMTSLAYYLLYVMPFYFAVLVLAGGMLRHYLRTRRVGSYREWRMDARGHVLAP